MLRLILVFLIILVGACYSLKGPFYVLLFYLWNAYFTPEHWVWRGDLIQPLRLSLVLGVVLVATTPFSSVKLRFDRRVLLLVLFLAQCALSLVRSEHQESVWTEFTQFFRIIVVSYLMIVLVTDTKRFGLVVLTISLSLGLEGTKQGWAHVLVHPGAVNTNPIRSLGDNNGVAVGMFMLVPLMFVCGQMRKTKGVQKLFKFVAVGVVFRALTTYSRGALLTGLTLATTYLVRSRGLRIVSAIVGVVVIATIFLVMLPGQYWDRMSTIITWSEERSATGRAHFWKVAVMMAEDRPVSGVGFSAYSLSYDDYDPSAGEYGTSRACHSSWFGVLADLGVTGLVLFVALFVLAFRDCRRVSALARAHPENEELAEVGKYGTALMYSLLAFVVGGAFVSMHYNEMVWHLLSLSIVLEALARKAIEDKVLEPPETAEPAISDLSSRTPGLVRHVE